MELLPRVREVLVEMGVKKEVKEEDDDPWSYRAGGYDFVEDEVEVKIKKEPPRKGRGGRGCDLDFGLG